MNGQTFLLPSGKKLKLREPAIEKMIKYRQLSSNDNEAGGILIGRILIESSDYIIDDITVPMKNDICRRTRFIRSSKEHQEYFNEKWEESEGRCFYLGEWHTHPEDIPYPSFIDFNDWERIVHQGHESNDMFFIIVGIKKIHVWHKRANSKQSTLLS
ncbi:Mov34/MPN/PAD-1 family protein [Ammoniphilus oxalaticus]|uniref:Mov34/MPN/PAD-1 family protein n=1 Tax=Ammoniphilus oxalaticus TaxID=66863 RepID=UPI0011C36FE0|nr:Mov34/MPN/PAD-1 family protein [Ammoniphilus oxalaticus]